MMKEINNIKTQESKLWKQLEERSNLLEKKEKEYGDEFPSMFNYPEIRNWYTETISPLDLKIVDIANKILMAYSQKTVTNIREVYDNHFLLNLHKNNKRR